MIINLTGPEMDAWRLLALANKTPGASPVQVNADGSGQPEMPSKWRAGRVYKLRMAGLLRPARDGMATGLHATELGREALADDALFARAMREPRGAEVSL